MSVVFFFKGYEAAVEDPDCPQLKWFLLRTSGRLSIQELFQWFRADLDEI